jgi:hypothetical protein
MEEILVSDIVFGGDEEMYVVARLSKEQYEKLGKSFALYAIDLKLEDKLIKIKEHEYNSHRTATR